MKKEDLLGLIIVGFGSSLVAFVMGVTIVFDRSFKGSHGRSTINPHMYDGIGLTVITGNSALAYGSMLCVVGTVLFVIAVLAWRQYRQKL